MNNTSHDQDYLSRSALAEQLAIPLKELTQMMMDAGWLTQLGKVWQLTAKGEFEGGQYRQSDKYGQYIVWPAAIITHPVLRNLNEDLVNVSSLAKQLELPARLINRVLAELGWIEAFAKGWQLTLTGKAYGGVQCHDDDSGILYVMWPRSIKTKAGFAQTMTTLLDSPSLMTLDGRSVKSPAHCIIANWLYLLGLTYSYRRQLLLPDDAQIIPDFYLPQHRLAIDYWPDALSPSALAVQLQKRRDYQAHQLSLVELVAGDWASIDHDLTKELLHLGISVY
jgi:hypothetical protein